jgi:hypothetical protein
MDFVNLDAFTRHTILLGVIAIILLIWAVTIVAVWQNRRAKETYDKKQQRQYQGSQE